MNETELRHINFIAASTDDRATLILQVMVSVEWRVWRVKEFADYFGVTKDTIRRPLAVLVAEGTLNECQYENSHQRNLCSWFYGYSVAPECWEAFRSNEVRRP